MTLGNDGLSGRGADRHKLCTVGYAGQGRDSQDVDENPWAREAKVQERDETLPTGKKCRFVATLLEQVERFCHALRASVCEPRGLHGESPLRSRSISAYLAGRMDAGP